MTPATEILHQRIGYLKAAIENLQKKEPCIDLDADKPIRFTPAWRNGGGRLSFGYGEGTLNFDRQGYKALLRILLEYWVEDSERWEELVKELGVEE